MPEACYLTDQLVVYHEARARAGVVSIGDCLAPRSVEEAVLEGLRAATAL